MSEAENTQPKYRDRAPKDSVAPPFEQAMRYLKLSNRSARHFLQNRLSLGMIKHMRAGRRNIPAWAGELLKDALLAQVEHYETIRRELLACAAQPRKRGNPQALRAYRLHRLAQKEKAAD